MDASIEIQPKRTINQVLCRMTKFKISHLSYIGISARGKTYKLNWSEVEKTSVPKTVLKSYLVQRYNSAE